MPRALLGFREFAGAGKRPACVRMVEGLYEVAIGPRVAIDLLVTLDRDLLVFLCVDGEVLVELPTAGVA